MIILLRPPPHPLYTLHNEIIKIQGPKNFKIIVIEHPQKSLIIFTSRIFVIVQTLKSANRILNLYNVLSQRNNQIKFNSLTAKKYLTCVSFCENRVDPDQTSTVWVHNVCQKATRTFQQTIKTDDFCCDWH